MNILNVIHQNIVAPITEKIGHLNKKVDGASQDPDLYKALLATDAAFAIATWSMLNGKGFMLLLHEVVGHGFFGYRMTTDYTNGVKPSFSIKPRTSSSNSLISFLFKLNFDGLANPGHGKPNWLGKRLGTDGTLAWHAFSGSVPQLFLDTALALGGIQLFKKHPFFGFFLTFYGLISHLSNARYPITAGLMSPQKLLSEAKMGHDFSRFAVCMSNITGANPQKIARITAAVFLLSVPLICLLYARSLKKQEPEAVPPT